MSRALVLIRTDADRQKVATLARNVQPGTRVEFRATRRSIPQNALMWKLLTQLSEQLPWYGQKLTPEDYKDMLTASLRKCRVVPGIDPGSFVPLGMRTSSMTKAEMTELIELIYAFGAERGVRFYDEAP